MSEALEGSISHGDVNGFNDTVLAQPDSHNIDPEAVSCANCISACCRAGMTIDLSNEEVMGLREAGTELSLYMRRKGDIWVKAGYSRYKMETDCGNLIVDETTGRSLCGAYEDRPDVCRRLPVGSYACLEFRSELGVDSPVLFTDYKARTGQ